MGTGRFPLVGGEDLIPPQPSASMTSSLRWTLEEKPDGITVDFSGEIDENADFTSLRPRLHGEVDFRLAGITRVNSCGVREWVNFVRDLPLVRQLRFVHCSPAFVTQLNTIYNFRGVARVRSLLAPYVCERCAVEEYKVIDVDDRFPGASMMVPSFPCARCGGAMEFDDLPERYLSFLKEV
jgi:hypothetical protein